MLFKIFSIPDNHSAKFRITTIRSINLSIILACTLAILGSTFIYSHERSHLLPSMYLLLGGSISLVLISQWFAHADKLDIAARLDIIATQGLAAILLIFESKQFGFVVLALAMCSLIVAALVINPKERKWFAISWLILYPALLMFTNILDIYFGISIVETYNVASNFSADTLYTRSVVIITGWIVHIAMITVTYGSLQYLNNEFEQRLIQVKEAQEHSQKLKRLDIQKSEFMAEMSHELRTPLNSIVSLTRIVTNERFGSIDLAQRDALEKSIANAEKLAQLINDILDISRIEAGKLSLFIEENIDVGVLLRFARDIAGEALQNKPVEIALYTDELPLIVADRTRISQVILNLVMNACKFTDTGKIEIFATASIDSLTIEVVDTGTGISEALLDRVFEPYQRTSAPSGGAGLGLPISKKLIEAHGGYMIAQSTISKGSVFGFVIPIKNPDLYRQVIEDRNHAHNISKVR